MRRLLLIPLRASLEREKKKVGELQKTASTARAHVSRRAKDDVKEEGAGRNKITNDERKSGTKGSLITRRASIFSPKFDFICISSGRA